MENIRIAVTRLLGKNVTLKDCYGVSEKHDTGILEMSGELFGDHYLTIRNSDRVISKLSHVKKINIDPDGNITVISRRG